MNTRFLNLLTATFVTALLLSNVIANKLVLAGPFVLAGATFLFPLTYIFGDVLTEVYGYAQTRRIIWTGFGLQVLAALVIVGVITLPSAVPVQGAAFDAALRTTPFIVVGSLLAYWCGEFCNSYVLARLKVFTNGRWLWTRTISSTIVGQAVDTCIFVAVAFGIGARLPMPLLWHLGWSVYVIKCLIEVVMTPVTYAVVGTLKRHDDTDVFDRTTNFNPFAMETEMLP